MMGDGIRAVWVQVGREEIGETKGTAGMRGDGEEDEGGRGGDEGDKAWVFACHGGMG